ncbi:hypothetical protein GCM10007856_17970 [Azospirillum oryzae]|nr:hypothetical protein GCM10007856_17970 [Azospirillum oryzae]
MPYKVNEPRRHKIPRARYRVENWSAYDAALRWCGDLTIWVTPEAIAAWTPTRSGRRGRPAAYSDIAIETGVMLRLAFGRPWRQTERLLRSIVQILGMELPVPDYTTLARRSARLSLAAALVKPIDPMTLAVDSSGLKMVGAGEWHLEKHGGKSRRSWRKLHIAIDPDSGDILAAELTTTGDGDACQVGPLLDQIPGLTLARKWACAQSLPRGSGDQATLRETGMPEPVMMFMTLQPAAASTFWVSRRPT